MGRRVLAAIAGGVVVFVWSAISHMALGLGTAGISTLPNEDRMAQAIRGAITEPGLYFFPGFVASNKITPAQEKAWTEKYQRGPSGILIVQPGGRNPMAPEQERAWTERYRRGPSGMIVVQPGGREPMEPTQFVVELLADILAAGVAAFLLTRLGGPFLARAGAVGLLGVFEWADINVSYWNWYKFPAMFTGAALLDQVVGWTLAGLVMAWMVRPRPAAAARIRP